MAIIFPDNPAVDEIQITGGQTWRWDGTAWKVTSSVGFTGSRGDLGYTGSQGPAGAFSAVGFTGSIGYTGSAGQTAKIIALNLIFGV